MNRTFICFGPSRMRQRAAGLATLAIILFFGSPVGAATDAPSISWKDGLTSESPLLHPGKADFLYRHKPSESTYNAFGWTPWVKAGFGVLDPDNTEATAYGGGYVRPLQAWTNRGEIILGGLAVDGPLQSSYEIQGEYRCPAGFGLGGGMVDSSGAGNDVVFGKATYRQRWGKLNLILEAQGQSFNDEVSPGGYVALYNPALMFIGGTDGEQWRTTLGYVSPITNGFVQPSLEALYVDNSIGNTPGPKNLFINGTLRIKGGFLAHPARLGRGMGPQGLEYGNPLGFLTPTWNRRLDVWEMGALFDARAERIKLPNGNLTERYEGLLFPFQFANTKTLADFLFVGGSFFKSSSEENPGFIAGFTGKLGFLNASVGVEHQFDPERTSVVVGLIEWF